MALATCVQRQRKPSVTVLVLLVLTAAVLKLQFVRSTSATPCACAIVAMITDHETVVTAPRPYYLLFAPFYLLLVFICLSLPLIYYIVCSY